MHRAGFASAKRVEKSEMRALVRFHLLTLLFVVAALCGMLTLNARPHPTVLGHISVHDGPLAPGVWVVGDDYGWPFYYHTKSYDYGHSQIRDVFDHFSWSALAGNILVLITVLLAVAGISETALWWRQKKA